MREQEEAEIIAAGLLNIKKGILTTNWNEVIAGYAKITGKVVEPIKKESKLEIIRRLTASTDEQPSAAAPKQRKPRKNNKIVIPSEITTEEAKIIGTDETGKAVEMRKQGEMTIITSSVDPEDIAVNSEVAKNKEKRVKRLPAVLPQDMLKGTDSNYRDNPPPRRPL